MKPRLSTGHETAMTLFEVGVIVAVLLVLAAVLLPISLRPRDSSTRRNHCINNLRQVSVAYLIWKGDNGNMAPMGVSITNGGSMEMVATGNVIQSFLVMSNELSTPKILYCPSDVDRVCPTTFSGLANSNISYFVGVDATNGVNPRMMFSGDCNFEIRGAPVKPGLLSVSTRDPAAWTETRHIRSGNICFADGSVKTVASAALRTIFAHTGVVTNRMAIP